MNTLTAKNPAASELDAGTGWLAAARRALAPWRRSETRLTQPEGAAALLARADLYEATQPSFAADLRAGAQRLLDAR